MELMGRKNPEKSEQEEEEDCGRKPAPKMKKENDNGDNKRKNF